MFCLGNFEFEEMTGKQLGIWTWAGDLSVGAVGSEVASEVVVVGSCVWGGGTRPGSLGTIACGGQ